MADPFSSAPLLTGDWLSEARVKLGSHQRFTSASSLRVHLILSSNLSGKFKAARLVLLAPRHHHSTPLLKKKKKRIEKKRAIFKRLPGML